MRRLRIGLAQIAPRLGALEANLTLHRQLITDAIQQDVDLLVFPELGLTGYLLQDLNAEVAMASDDARLRGLAADAREMSVIVGFVERSSDAPAVHRRRAARGGRSAARLSEVVPAQLRAVRRAPLLRLLERRSGAVDSSSGARLGLCICEDFWHLPVPYLLALDGAQLLVNISSSPGRDIAAVEEGGLGTANSWRTLMRAYAQLTTSFVVFVNRVGVEESVTFWGGSQVIAPAGEVLFEAPLLRARPARRRHRSR